MRWKVVAISHREHHAGKSPPLGANQTGSKQRGPGDDGHINDKRKKRCHLCLLLDRSVVRPAALLMKALPMRWVICECPFIVPIAVEPGSKFLTQQFMFKIIQSLTHFQHN